MCHTDGSAPTLQGSDLMAFMQGFQEEVVVGGVAFKLQYRSNMRELLQELVNKYKVGVSGQCVFRRRDQH